MLGCCVPPAICLAHHVQISDICFAEKGQRMVLVSQFLRWGQVARTWVLPLPLRCGGAASELPASFWLAAGVLETKKSFRKSVVSVKAHGQAMVHTVLMARPRASPQGSLAGLQLSPRL